MRDRKNPRRFIIATGACLVLAACGEAPTAPARSAPPVRTAASLGTTAGGSVDTSYAVFVVNPLLRQTFSLTNGNKITFGARAICDPLTSSYGPTEWDKPCDALLLPVTVKTLSWYDRDGHPHVEFSPRLRFNPAAEQVTLYLKDKNDLSAGYGINYCPDDGSACYDESITDPSLTTYRSTTSGNFYFRRIKHFSGYNIASGRSEEAY